MTRWNIADSIEDLELFGGRLCLDFANTVEPRRADVAGHDHLSSYAELVRWGAYVGTVDEDTAQRLRRAADEHPEEAEDVLGEAVELREAIYRTFHGLARAEKPDPEDLDVLGEAYAKAMPRSRIVATDTGGFELGWQDADSLEAPLWPVARSAVELLTEAEPGRIKQCSIDEGCGWLFYDDSKNNSRRWCSMQGCGSRAKMRRMYARRRDAQEHPDR
jgi:predicted RNA-binding Zn ribbon-like protein